MTGASNFLLRHWCKFLWHRSNVGLSCCLDVCHSYMVDLQFKYSGSDRNFFSAWGHVTQSYAAWIIDNNFMVLRHCNLLKFTFVDQDVKVNEQPQRILQSHLRISDVFVVHWMGKYGRSESGRRIQMRGISDVLCIEELSILPHSLAQ